MSCIKLKLKIGFIIMTKLRKRKILKNFFISFINLKKYDDYSK